MRFIHKGAEPETLREYKALANENWQPTYGDMPGKRKSIIKKALTAEQKGLCCYCECILDEGYSHIEHLKPQKGFEDLALDYGNMLCSCMAEQAKGEPLHCGMAKENWYDDKLMISPLDQNCEQHFKFLGDGRIEPVDAHDKAAIATIDHLKLDDVGLTESRKRVLDTFLDVALTDDERDRFVADYLSETSGSPSEFISAVRSVLT